MSEWFETLEGLHSQIWARLAAGVADRTAPARRIVLATTSPTGWPEARTVVLRRAEAGVLELHTDLHSSKVASLRNDPRAALLVWDACAALQIRIEARVAIQSGAEVAETWARVPDPSRQSYGVTPPPGQPIPEALAYVKRADPVTFAVLCCEAVAIDVLHLGPEHRRARFEKAGGWAGQWLAP